MDKSGYKSGRLIYGGCFNPIHIGHLRLAIEARMLMKNFFTHVDFVPTAYPPHKKNGNFLPFDLRAELVNASLVFDDNFKCCEIESNLPSPSYSEQTLRAFLSRFPDEKLYFLMGSYDFALLPEWRNGLALPDYCDLVIAPRNNMDFAEFLLLCKKMWPEKIIIPGEPEIFHDKNCGKVFHVSIEGSGRIFFLQIPFLDISSTYIRKLWLEGEKVDFLVPFAVLDLLEKKRSVVTMCWRSQL